MVNICSQCEKMCETIKCFINKETKEVWCQFCLGNEKIKRAKDRYGTIIHRWHQID